MTSSSYSLPAWTNMLLPPLNFPLPTILKYAFPTHPKGNFYLRVEVANVRTDGCRIIRLLVMCLYQKQQTCIPKRGHQTQKL